MIRTSFVVAFAAVAITVGVAACSSSSDDNSSSSSGTSGTSTSASKFQNCSSASTPASCKQADFDTYASCLQDKCDSQYQKCYGPGYKSGTFSGACGTLVECEQKCGCSDAACIKACGAASTDCASCTQGFTTCAQECTLPACYSATTPDAGGTGTTGSHTCAQLTACCAKLTDADQKNGCTQAAGSGSDSSCSQVYPGFSQLAGGCD